MSHSKTSFPVMGPERCPGVARGAEGNSISTLGQH